MNRVLPLLIALLVVFGLAHKPAGALAQGGGLLRAANFRIMDTTRLVLNDTVTYTLNVINEDSMNAFQGRVNLWAYVNVLTPVNVFLLDSVANGFVVPPSGVVSHTGTIHLSASRWRAGENVIVIWPDGTTNGSGPTSPDTLHVTISLSAVASMKDARTVSQQWQLGPNPATETATLFTDFALEAVAIYDLTGRVVWQAEMPVPAGAMMLLPLANLPAGVYSVQVRGAGGMMSAKLLYHLSAK